MKRSRLTITTMLVVCWLLGVATVALAQASQYTLPGEAVYPEGIAYVPGTGDFYVSATGNGTINGDGTILKGNTGQPAAAVWIPGGRDGLTAPRGMKVDGKGRLIVCGGPQAAVWVYNTANAAFLGRFNTGVTPSFCNDVAVAPDGKAYMTDSLSPFLYRLGELPDGTLTLEKWIDVSSVIQYATGFNLGGIAASADGQYLIVAQGNTGLLYRINIATKQITPINIGGETVRNVDGIWLDGQTLYVMRNAEKTLVTINLASDLGSGTVVSSTVIDSLSFPTTIAKAGNRLLVVNGQFDKRQSGPTLPFTVSSIPVTGGMPTALPTTGATQGGQVALALLALGAIILALGIWWRAGVTQRAL